MTHHGRHFEDAVCDRELPPVPGPTGRFVAGDRSPVQRASLGDRTGQPAGSSTQNNPSRLAAQHPAGRGFDATATDSEPVVTTVHSDGRIRISGWTGPVMG